MKSRLQRWLAAFGFWTLVGLFYSSKKSIRGQPSDWVSSFKNAMPQWYIWGFLAPLIIVVDKRLPVPREALFRRALWHIPIGAVFTGLFLYLESWSEALLGLRPDGLTLSPQVLVDGWRGGFHWNLLIYWVILGAYCAYDYYSRYQERRVREAELETLLAESRLDNLRAQLHPHFLFNALNAVSAQIENDPRGARRTLEQLGELLRLSLDHSESQEIPLEQELAFLDRYLAIQKTRFDDRLDVSIDADPDALDALAPTFVLQPLVENAIRHGVALRSLKGSIAIEARRENGSLRLRVADDGPGLPRGWSFERDAGVGLRNTRERLRRLYNGDHSFHIAAEPGSGTAVEMTLPYRAANGDHANDQNGRR